MIRHRLFVSAVATVASIGFGIVSAGVPVQPQKNPFAGDAWQLPPENPVLKPGEGLASVTGNCVLCHSVDYISTQPPLLRAQWTATVEKMRAKFGATIATNQVPGIVEYLATAYGRKDPVK